MIHALQHPYMSPDDSKTRRERFTGKIGLLEAREPFVPNPFSKPTPQVGIPRQSETSRNAAVSVEFYQKGLSNSKFREDALWGRIG